MIHPLDYPVSPSPTYVFSGQSIILWASFHLLGAEDIQRQHNKPLFSQAYLSGTGSWNLWTHFNLTTSLRGLPHWLSWKILRTLTPNTVSVMDWIVSLQNPNVTGTPWGSNGWTQHLSCCGLGSIPGQGHSQKKKKKNNNKKTAPSLKTNK